MLQAVQKVADWHAGVLGPCHAPGKLIHTRLVEANAGALSSL